LPEVPATPREFRTNCRARGESSRRFIHPHIIIANLMPTIRPSLRPRPLFLLAPLRPTRPANHPRPTLYKPKRSSGSGKRPRCVPVNGGWPFAAIRSWPATCWSRHLQSPITRCCFHEPCLFQPLVMDCLKEFNFRPVPHHPFSPPGFVRLLSI
jgi:hypothetical protein